MPKQKYTSSFKVRTVLEGLKSLDGIVPQSGIVGAVSAMFSFTGWQKQLLENADLVVLKMPKATKKLRTQVSGAISII